MEKATRQCGAVQTKQGARDSRQVLTGCWKAARYLIVSIVSANTMAANLTGYYRQKTPVETGLAPFQARATRQAASLRKIGRPPSRGPQLEKPLKRCFP